jgi:hypothetical protein
MTEAFRDMSRRSHHKPRVRHPQWVVAAAIPRGKHRNARRHAEINAKSKYRRQEGLMDLPDDGAIGSLQRQFQTESCLQHPC